MAKCVPCVHPELKELILKEFQDHGIKALLENTPDCRDGIILNLCSAGKGGKRPRSEWQQFASECLKGKKIKGFGQASGAMKECAAEWRNKK